MENKLTFSIAIHPAPTKFSTFLFLFLAAFTFIPFTYGLITQDEQAFYFILCLPLGLLGIPLFHYFTDFKFTPSKIIQKDKFIAFDENEVKVWENQEYVLYSWNELENIEINLIAYKGKFVDEDMESRYEGIENYILFTFQDITHKYFFYIETAKEFNFTSDYFRDIVLLKLYESKKIKNENIIISRLEYAELQKFKLKYNINRYTNFIHFN